MTSGQRKMHVMLWLLLGPIAVVGLVLAVAMRPGAPIHEGALPGVEVNDTPPSQAEDQARNTAEARP